MKNLTYLTIGLGVIAIASSAGANQAPAPTCSEEMGIDVHGQHVIEDYVAGDGLGWPPTGSDLGDYLAGRGAALPGGPGPGFHFPAGVAPGASFCTGSNSPGFHF